MAASLALAKPRTLTHELDVEKELPASPTPEGNPALLTVFGVGDGGIEGWDGMRAL